MLFPRYIFIRVDTSRKSVASVRSTRGVVGLVRFGGQPAVVADEIIEAIIRREVPNTGLHQDCRPLFCVGEPVRLMDGPFAGMEGVFAEEDSEKRVIVLLELLGKINKVKVGRDLVAIAA